MVNDMSRPFKKTVLTAVLFIFCISANASIAVNRLTGQDIPAYKNFLLNTEYMVPLKFKKITVAEYLTDPIILYASLWACIGLNLPLREENWTRTPIENPDGGRLDSFNVTVSTTPGTFFDRMKMEPFATGRIDWVTTQVRYNNDKINILNLDFYGKNIVEPVFFTGMALYLRSKNYHPALYVFEMFALSALYEFTIRPFYSTASFEQLLKNPAVGIINGIMIDELSTFLLSTPFIGLHVLAYILNPFNALPVARVHSMLLFDVYRKSASIEAVIRL
jgi:hypothetical protein